MSQKNSVLKLLSYEMGIKLYQLESTNTKGTKVDQNFNFLRDFIKELLLYYYISVTFIPVKWDIAINHHIILSEITQRVQDNQGLQA